MVRIDASNRDVASANNKDQTPDGRTAGPDRTGVALAARVHACAPADSGGGIVRDAGYLRRRAVESHTQAVHPPCGHRRPVRPPVSSHLVTLGVDRPPLDGDLPVAG